MTGRKVDRIGDPAAHLPYRKGVGVVLFNDRGEVFAGQRIDSPVPAWQMPQGGREADEDPWQAALRELAEEIGTTAAQPLAMTEQPIRYDLPPELLGKVWGGRYRGQEQIWFAARFLGRDADIRLDATNHPEFRAWRWMPFAALVAQIVPFKRALYEELYRRFGHLAEEIYQSGDS